MKNENGKRIMRRVALILLALVLVLGGLWTGMLEDSAQNLTAYETANVAASHMASGSSSSRSAKFSSNETMEVEASYDTAADYDTGVSTYGAVQQPERKLVRTADLSIRTNAFDDALTFVQEQLTEMGGYIENLYQHGESARRITLMMRVPSEKLDAFLLSLEGTGKVTDRSESTVDMTTQYSDNEARLKTLYDKRDRLNELLLKAEDVSDLIEIESAIADTQYQIDRYETSQRSIDRQVEMSSVSLTLMEQEQTVVNPELSLMERIRAGFVDSISWLGTLLRNIIVFVVMVSPVIAVIVVIWLGWKLIRKLRKREE